MRRRQNPASRLDCKLSRSQLAARLACPSGPALALGQPARAPKPARATQSDYDCSVKLTVTVMMTGTGTPLSIVGVYSH